MACSRSHAPHNDKSGSAGYRMVTLSEHMTSMAGCSSKPTVASRPLAQTLKLNGQPIQPNQAYMLEQDALIQTAIANASNTQLLIALVWVVSQNNYQQLDNWFSSAILTDPINSNAQPAPKF